MYALTNQPPMVLFERLTDTLLVSCGQRGSYSEAVSPLVYHDRALVFVADFCGLA